MAEQTPDLSGLETALRLKSDLVRALMASGLAAWPQHLSRFAARLDASPLHDTTAILVLLAGVRVEVRLLAGANGAGPAASATWPPVESWGDLSKSELLARFRDEMIAATQGAGPGGPVRSPLVHQVVRFIDSHYAEPLTLDLLASELGRSRRHLAAVFRKQTGQTIHTYLTQVRVLRALALIRAGEKIESVSQTVGYRSKKNFYRHFKEALGVTPVAYKTGMIALQLRPAVRPIPTNG